MILLTKGSFKNVEAHDGYEDWYINPQQIAFFYAKREVRLCITLRLTDGEIFSLYFSSETDFKAAISTIKSAMGA